MSVHRYLVTAPTDARLQLWIGTAEFANWIEGRPNRHQGETWMVTVMGEEVQLFLDLARHTDGVTVEELEGAEDTEQYLLRVGMPGTGWAE